MESSLWIYFIFGYLDTYGNEKPHIIERLFLNYRLLEVLGMLQDRSSVDHLSSQQRIHGTCLKYTEPLLVEQVAGNNWPLYPKVNHHWFKVAQNDEPLALQALSSTARHAR